MRDDPIDATRALLDDIAAVGIGGHFLGRRSTRAVPPRRRGLAAARVAARAVRGSTQGRPLVEEAAARADEILRTHEVQPLPDDVAAEIDAVIERYARSVGAPAARVRWRETA